MSEDALRKAGCSIFVGGAVYFSRCIQVGNVKNGVFTTLPVYASKTGVEKSNETIITESVMKKELDRWANKRGLALVQKDLTNKRCTYDFFSLCADKPELMGAAVEGYRKFGGYRLTEKIEEETEKKVKETLRLVRENLPKLSKRNNQAVILTNIVMNNL